MILEQSASPTGTFLHIAPPLRQILAKFQRRMLPAPIIRRRATELETSERDVAYMGSCRSFCAYGIATLLLRLISIDTSLLNENTTNLVCWEPLFESIFSFVLFLFAARPRCWTSSLHEHYGKDTPITAFYDYRQA
jgi:p-aminobenzoyl-glutamate transporter AbgT